MYIYFVEAEFWQGWDRGFCLLYLSFVEGCSGGVAVCVCICAYSHTKYLGTWYEPRLWDGHLENQKNPDGLKRSKNVDRIRIKYICLYIYAGLWVLMIWANCFVFWHVFSFEKSIRCNANQQTQPLRWNWRAEPWEFTTKLIHYNNMRNNQSNLRRVGSTCMSSYVYLDTHLFCSFGILWIMQVFLLWQYTHWQSFSFKLW
jgi:hypothetical protein